ncbi:MAG TPA: TlpA disulfide reductase family protein [Chitinophagaceae bacterium]
MKKVSFFFILSLFAAGCAHFSQKDMMRLQEGSWRGVLHRADGVDVPFNFEVTDSANKSVMYIRNGAGRLLVDHLRYHGDTLFIRMPFFDSDFWAHFQNDGSLKGEWIKHYPDTNKLLKFTATPNTLYRITPTPAPARFNVSGRWRTTFISGDKKDTEQAVGEFEQKGNLLTGTFLTTSGDYRYLQGVMDGDTLRLSTFDGSHVYLFTAQAVDSNTLVNGLYYSGFTGKNSWTAERDSSAHLPDAFSLTSFTPGDRLSFRFPDLKGDTVSINDPRFKNKVVIVQIMGSWCPNCMDETRFMGPWYRENKDRGVEIIGLCYERSTDFKTAVKNILSFKDHFGVEYPLLVTGITPSDPRLLEKTLPQLKNFIGFPTTIFINRKGEIAKVEAGFSGPGTGAHYQEFIRKFNQLVNQLLAE